MNENLQPLEAELVEIHATAKEAANLRDELLAKTTIIRSHVKAQQKAWGMQNEFRLPDGPMRIGGTWYV